MTFKSASLNSWSIKMFVGKCRFCVFNESLGNSKESYLALVVFYELDFGIYWELMAMIHLLKIRTSIDISVLKSVKLLLVFSI